MAHEPHDFPLEIEMFLRRKYTVTRSERSDVVGAELCYLTAEVNDLVRELARFIAERDRDNLGDILHYTVAPHRSKEQPIAWFKYGHEAQKFAQEKSRTNSVRWVVTINGKPYSTYFRGDRV